MLTDPASNLEIPIFSRSGIKIGMVNWLREWFPGGIVGCFELVSPCPKLTCSVILFDTANGITGFPPDISPFPGGFSKRWCKALLGMMVQNLAGSLPNRPDIWPTVP